MLFKRLFAKNFLSIGKSPVEILFTNGNGVTYIRGQNYDVSQKSSNGAGKSTLIEALLFALYGRTLRILNSDGIIHHKAGEECHVELEFDDIKIVRYIRMKRGRAENRVELYIGGVRQGTDASVTEVKKEIENRLAVNFDTMRNILVFGQHNIVSFLDAGEPEKREIVENLMNLSEYNGYEDKAKTLVRETKTSIKVAQETLEVHGKHLGEHIALRAQQERALQEYQNKVDTEIAAINGRLDAIPNMEFIRKEWDRFNDNEQLRKITEDKLSVVTSARNAVVNELSAVLTKKQDDAKAKEPLVASLLNSKQKLLDASAKRNDLIKERLEPIDAKRDVLRQKYIALEQERDAAIGEVTLSQNWHALLTTAANDLEKAKKTFDEVKNKNLDHDATCEHCFGKIDINNASNYLIAQEVTIEALKNAHAELVKQKTKDKDRVEAEKEAITKKYAGLIDLVVTGGRSLLESRKSIEEEIESSHQEATASLSDSISKITQDVADFDAKLDQQYVAQIVALDASKNEYQRDFGILTRELHQLTNVKKPSVTLDELAQMQANAEMDRKMLAEKKEARKVNPFQDIITQITTAINKVDVEMKTIEATMTEWNKLLPYYEYWVYAFGKEGIKSFVINQIVPTLNQQIEYWMQIIYQGSIGVRFDKLLNVKIVNNASKNEMVFGQGSGGERRRIDIAIMLAFRQIMQMSTGRNPNIVFFDEVAENLDEDGIYRLYETLEDIGKTNRVFVITHNTTLLNLLQNSAVIDVQKKDGAMTLA